MDDIVKAYEELINPVWIRAQFRTDSGFANWCFESEITDLECMLRVFLDAEMYEDCAIIRDVIEFKKI